MADDGRGLCGMSEGYVAIKKGRNKTSLSVSDSTVGLGGLTSLRNFPLIGSKDAENALEEAPLGVLYGLYSCPVPHRQTSLQDKAREKSEDLALSCPRPLFPQPPTRFSAT